MNIKTRKNAIHNLIYDGTGIKEAPDKPQDSGQAEEIARKIPRKQRVNPDSVERWK